MMGDENIDPKAPDSKNPSLQQAVENAQILLAYAAENGVDIDEETTKAVVAADSALKSSSMSNDDETRFWGAFNTLAKKVAPVGVGSLRSIFDPQTTSKTFFGKEVSGRSLARRAVNRYTIIALIALGALLVFQIYWLFGTAITSGIQNNNVNLNEARIKLQLAKQASNSSQQKSKVASAEPLPVSSQPIEDLRKLDVLVMNLELHKTSGYELLEFWSLPWQIITEKISKTKEGSNPAEREIRVNTSRLQTSLIVLEVLQRYILPLLYGLLGTSVYILRTLSSEIRTRIYSEASNIGFNIRLYLGTLGGMVFAWFVIPDSAGSAESGDGLFKSLSPFALAFLAGYSVELLFSAMDRFIGAFTTTKSSG